MGSQSRPLTQTFQLTALAPTLRASQSPTVKRQASLEGKREFKIGMITDSSTLPGISIFGPIQRKRYTPTPPRVNPPA
jgi:hypothetical protein